MINTNVLKIRTDGEKMYDCDDKEMYIICSCNGNVITVKQYWCDELEETKSFSTDVIVRKDNFVIIKLTWSPKWIRDYAEKIEVEHTAKTEKEEIQKIKEYFEKKH